MALMIMCVVVVLWKDVELGFVMLQAQGVDCEFLLYEWWCMATLTSVRIMKRRVVLALRIKYYCYSWWML